ncbi:MAG: class I SAM-dependent methyltransferase [Acidimicrobiales bacterium]
MDEPHAPPNHHADYPGFAGIAGLVAALSMAFGRQGDAQLAVRLSGMASGDSVVDIGCGPGVAVRYAARHGAIVTGVDPATVMLRMARFLSRRGAKVRYVEGAAEAIPLPEGSASIVWSIATVHHWSDIDGGLREVRRVLRPGGRLVAMERRAQPGARGHGSHGWTDEQAAGFADRCREHGFGDVRLERATIGRRSTISVVASAP